MSGEETRLSRMGEEATGIYVRWEKMLWYLGWEKKLFISRLREETMGI